MSEYLRKPLIIFNLFMVAMACFYLIIRPLIYFQIIYNLPLDWRYRFLSKVDNQTFRSFEGATTVIVTDYMNLDREFKSVIEDSEKVKFAREFIRRYPDGWVTDGKFSHPNCIIRLSFYDDAGHFLGGYGIGSDKALVYSGPNGIWRFVGKEEMKPLIEILDIPERLLFGRPTRYGWMKCGD